MRYDWYFVDDPIYQNGELYDRLQSICDNVPIRPINWNDIAKKINVSLIAEPRKDDKVRHLIYFGLSFESEEDFLKFKLKYL